MRDDVGVAGHCHPGIAPDEVEHPRRHEAGWRGHCKFLPHFVSECRGPLGDTRQMAEVGEQLIEQPQVVFRRAWVGDHNMGHEPAQLLHGVGPVLVHIDQHMGGCQRTDALDLHVLGPSDLGDSSHHLGRVDAETSAADECSGEPQGAPAVRSGWAPGSQFSMPRLAACGHGCPDSHQRWGHEAVIASARD
jgi:hypothetical protein